jgi:cyanophycin synthetase
MSSQSVEPLSFRKVLALRGPNIWTNKTVLEAWVELADLQHAVTNGLDGFNDRLKEWLPTLVDHRGSIGERGGFLEQLWRGSNLAHALEHVALELQFLAGNDVHFGRAIPLMDEPGVYRVAIEYVEEAVARAALETARRLVLAAVHNTPFEVQTEIAVLRDLAQDVCLGPSTRAIVDAAKRRGIPYTRLSTNSLVQLGYGANQRRICTAETDRTSAIAESIAQDKELTRRLLHNAGIPVPIGRSVESAEDAWEAAQDIGLPVVVKPQYGNHGRGVATNLNTREEVVKAYAAAREEESTIVVESFIEGDDYRILVVGDHMVAAARRVPAQVVGDGKATIRQLVDEVNKDPRRSDGHATVLSFIKIDTVAESVLAQQGLTPDSIPSVGQRVLIRRNANLSTGGMAIDVTSKVHPEVAARAVEAAKIIGLDIAGIDVVTTSIAASMESKHAAIVEVNAGPGLRMHLEPSEGQGQPVGEAIIDSLFPPQSNGRIPIVAITGVNGKTTVTRLIAHIMFIQGKRVGMTTTDGVYVMGRRIDKDDCSGPKSARRILCNPLIDAAVLETARGGILREGLAFDQCDVAVVTNIGEGDHLGLSNIHTVEQLADVKRTIVDAVSPYGHAVINADDPLVVAMASKCPGAVVFFSHNADNPYLLERRKAGGRVVFVRDQSLILAHGDSEFSLISLDKIPLTHGGRIRFQIENVMAAAAATWAQGIPAQVIRAGLECFSSNVDGSPGRFNIVEWGGATVIIDYGHNPSALKNVLDAICNYPSKRRIALYSTAGDRRDEDMIRQGQMLGHFFDRVILYEGAYVRGRAPGDIMQLFREGMAIGARINDYLCFANWTDAVNCALGEIQVGDLLLIQADSVDESVAFFRDLMTRSKTK